MALFEFTNFNKHGNIRTRIIHRDTPTFGFNPKGFGKMVQVKRFVYEVEDSLVPPRIFETYEGDKYIVPQWIKVHPKATDDDIVVKKAKKKRVKKDVFTVTSGSGDYHVRFDPYSKQYTCDCMGFWRVKDKKKGCKHIIEVRNKNK